MSKRLSLVVAICLVVSTAGAVDWVAPEDYVIAGVIGASYEHAQAPPYFAVAPSSWYFGGAYKTWVDEIACMQDKTYHWLNYAAAGDVSINGANQLNELLANTLWPDETGQVSSTVEVLVIGFWGNDFIWLPTYDEQVMAALVQNVQDQIAIAKAAGIEWIIVTGWPEYDEFDLDTFIAGFPELPTHIDEAGYEDSKIYYYNAFAGPNADYLFVDPWCFFNTIDGVHPGAKASSRAALRIRHALHHYDRLVGVESLLCR